jgi:hypothetical protein
MSAELLENVLGPSMSIRIEDEAMLYRVLEIAPDDLTAIADSTGGLLIKCLGPETL